MGQMKILNDTKLILKDYGVDSCSFWTNLVSFRTFRCPIFPKPVSWFGLFLAVSYSKPALGRRCRCLCHCTIDLDWQVPINSTMHLSCHLATILYTFFFVNMHAGKNQLFSWNFFFGENNRKLLYGSLTLLKVNLLTENPFLTCCQSLYEIVFEHSSSDIFFNLRSRTGYPLLKLLIRTKVGAVSYILFCTENTLVVFTTVVLLYYVQLYHTGQNPV